MKTKRFDLNWKPLQLQTAYIVDGSVPDAQNYNAYTKEYTPDYRITPLTIQPIISILDKDDVLPAGRVNHVLTNIRWYEIINGRRKLIAEDNADYEITTAGGLAGRIKINKNAEPKVPITLEFYAEYIDSRNNQVNVIRGTYAITCGNAANAVRVELNAAEQTVYNPLTDRRDQVIKAIVWVGATICAPGKYSLVWEVMNDGNWHQVGRGGIKDGEISINSDGNLVIDRWLMGSGTSIRCRVKYSAEGTPEAVELNDATPCAVAAFVRRIPKYECEIDSAPYNIPAGLLEIAPTAVIRGINGVIPNAEKELLPLWYMAKNRPTGSLSYTLAAHGSTPVISTDMIDSTHGAVIGLDVIDRGGIGLITDADGRAFTDADGTVFIMH